MKIIVIIPARYDSSRFSGKPLALIGGKSMIQRVYKSAKKSKSVTDILVATDDKRIVNLVDKFGGKFVFTSKSCRSGADRVAEAADIYGLSSDDIIVNIQGDQPLLDFRCIDEVVQPFFQGFREMSTLGYKIVNKDEITNPKDVKVVFDRKGFALYFSRSPIPCSRDEEYSFDTYKHLGVYAYTKNFLEKFKKLKEGKLERIEKLEQLRALEYGFKIKVVITKYDSPEVDLPEDIKRIERMIEGIS
mmetsp:Transcript_1300/g.954  ORF Transcript_1300/g.954 Transcript_1300/m.954 type:complete len:246 (+) Transcript_1300:182-919(+)